MHDGCMTFSVVNNYSRDWLVMRKYLEFGHVYKIFLVHKNKLMLIVAKIENLTQTKTEKYLNLNAYFTYFTTATCAS